MVKEETPQERSQRILSLLRTRYPGKDAFDVDGSANHFAAEIEPAEDHPEYDRAIEVVIKSKPHLHHKMKQRFKILSGKLRLHIGENVITLSEGETYDIPTEIAHWAEGEGETWVEVYSEPGWTAEDHIPVT